MRTGDVINALTGDGPITAEVKSVLFTGTSRYVPDGRSDPWRDLIIIESRRDSIVIRDRERAPGVKRPVSNPQWFVGSKETAIDWLSSRVASTLDEDSKRLYRRAILSLEMEVTHV